jgi:hypothetical protein
LKESTGKRKNSGSTSVKRSRSKRGKS